MEKISFSWVRTGGSVEGKWSCELLSIDILGDMRREGQGEEEEEEKEKEGMVIQCDL